MQEDLGYFVMSLTEAESPECMKRWCGLSQKTQLVFLNVLPQ